MAHDDDTLTVTGDRFDWAIKELIEAYAYQQDKNRDEFDHIAYQLQRIAEWLQELTEVLRDAGKDR